MGVAWSESGDFSKSTGMSRNSYNGHPPYDSGSIQGSGFASSPLGIAASKAALTPTLLAVGAHLLERSSSSATVLGLCERRVAR